MGHLKVPLAPIPAFGLFLMGFAGIAYALGFLKRSTLHILGISDLASVASEGLRWAVRQQLLSGWFLVTLGCTGLVALALQMESTFMIALGIAGLILFATPLLVLRPRWLDWNTADPSWRPSAAALGVYLLFELLDWVAAAGLSTMAGTVGDVVSFVLSVLLAWLVASVLVFLQHWQEIRAHLLSRLNRRFLALVCVGTAHPVTASVAWLLPTYLLAFYYSIYIAPTMSQLAPYLPGFLTTAHRVFSSFTGVFADYWWIASMPLLAVAWNLYIGRCLVLFENHETQANPRSTVFNTFP